MPLCPDTTNQLKENAAAHVRAQKAVVRRLDRRIDEMEEEVKTLDPESPRAKAMQKAIANLRLEVRGQRLNPNTGEYEQVKKTGEERLSVMEALYLERQPRRFTYNSRDGQTRNADIYGMPTIQEMKNAGFEEAAREMAVRAISLISTGDTSRNPYDYLGTEGLEVKDALDRVIEHHHIYNNCVVKEDGGVHALSIGILSGKDGKPEVKVIPAYHGYDYTERRENQMDAVQFVCLMDAMHSGEDPVAHLHYFKFDGEEAASLKAKAIEKAQEKAIDAKAKLPRLQEELKVLQARRIKPEEYEKKLKDREDVLAKQYAKYLDENGKARRLPKGSDEAAKRSAIQSELNTVRNDLAKHNLATSLKNQIEEQESQMRTLRTQKKAIAGKASYARKLLKEGKRLTDEQKQSIEQNDKLTQRLVELEIALKKSKAALEKEGSIDLQIETKKKKIQETVYLSKLTPEAAAKLFDDSNGFFSFDKGKAEKDAHETFRPKMNEEITKFVAREALQYIKDSGTELESFFRQEYHRNISNRLAALAAKIPKDL